MTAGTALEIAKPATEPNANDFAIIRRNAEILVSSGLMPEGIKTWQAAFAVIQKGREIGIPAMSALNSIHVIKGKPTLSAELMLALIYRDHGDEAFQWVDTSPAVAKARYKRRGQRGYSEHAFTMEDAKKAGLAGSGNWAKYPGAMLRSRCISAIARMAFPDSIGGFYTTEELDPSVSMDEVGQVMPSSAVDPDVIDAASWEATGPPPQTPTSPSVVPFKMRNGSTVDMLTGVKLEAGDMPDLVYTQGQWNDAVALYAERKSIDALPEAYKAVCDGAGVRGKSSQWTEGEGGQYQTMIDWIAGQIGYTPTPETPDVTADTEGDDDYGF